MMLRIAACAAALLLHATTARAQIRVDAGKLVDLTHSFDESTIYWPTAKPFEWHRESWGKTAGGYWYASASFAASEHLGTHIDSPIHFGEGQATTNTIPVSQLVGAGVVIDISQQSAGNRDYLLSPADLAAWEKAN